ncbi:NAD(P)-dependent oxidoreductase, partial [Pseudoalteromonas sp. 2CM28B]|nr:NAD(P)-dependent oxidoreductase [Pseudoalteromonas sp. 2CM28B]
KCPEIALAFKQRGWQLPQSLDRVYDSSFAREKLGWSPIHGFESVLEMLDTETAEVLPILKRS